MKILKILVSLGTSLVAFALSAHATVLFHNTGTTSGWDLINEEHDGSVLQVTNVVFKGSTAIKCIQIYDSSYTGRYHSEVAKNNVYSRGDSGFYGFAFRLQSDWQFQDQRYNIAQFIADFTDDPDNDCSETWMPSSMVWLYNDQLYTRVKSGSICNPTTNNLAEHATVSAGVWHAVVIQANWQSDNTGYYKLWLDGVKLLEYYNLPTTIAKDQSFQFRVGLYANGWHDDGMMVGTQGTRSVWIDQIGAGSTFADADPNQW